MDAIDVLVKPAASKASSVGANNWFSADIFQPRMVKEEGRGGKGDSLD